MPEDFTGRQVYTLFDGMFVPAVVLKGAEGKKTMLLEIRYKMYSSGMTHRALVHRIAFPDEEIVVVRELWKKGVSYRIERTHFATRRAKAREIGPILHTGSPGVVSEKSENGPGEYVYEKISETFANGLTYTTLKSTSVAR